MGFRGLGEKKSHFFSGAIRVCWDWCGNRQRGQGLTALSERINSRPVSVCAHYKPIFSKGPTCSLALDEGWNWGFGAVGGHSQQQSSHTSPLLSPSKKLLFKKKIKYVKPFTKDRMRDQSQNQLWKTTTIILLLRYFNSFNLKLIFAKTKLSHPQVDQHHI